MCGFHNNSSDFTHLNGRFLSRVRITYHRQCNKQVAKRLWGCVNADTKDIILRRVVTFDAAKHFIILIETLFKDLPFLFIKQHKLWNDEHLRIAMVTRFS